MSITSDGNVGIGTDAPDHALVVGEASGDRHLVINDIATARWGFKTGGYDLAIQNDWGNSWNTRFLITQDGNVGIGTTDPESKLEVAGDMKLGKTDSRHFLQIASLQWPEVSLHNPKLYFRHADWYGAC